MNWSNRLTHQIILGFQPLSISPNQEPTKFPSANAHKGEPVKTSPTFWPKITSSTLPISPQDLIKMTSNIAWTNSCNPCTLAHQSESWPLRLHIKNRFLASTKLRNLGVPKITLLRMIPTMTFQNSNVRFYVSLIGSGEGRHTTHLLKCVLLLSTSQTD